MILAYLMASLWKKAVSVAVVIAVISNLVLFGFGRISPVPFWSVIAVAAIFAYAVLPRLKD